MSSGNVSLERVAHLTPLGIRFWDSVTHSVVGAGLRVEAYPASDEAANPLVAAALRYQRVASFVTFGGNHAFRGLPGMRDVECGDVALDVAQRRRFVIEVSDMTQQQFLPFSLTVELPVRGLLPWEAEPVMSPLTSPLSRAPPAVPLFSTPSRAAPAGWALVRAELWDADANAPASGALLEITAPGLSPRLGWADGQGRAAALLPYPGPPQVLPELGSPLSRSEQALSDQAWNLRLRAYYQPSAPADYPDLSFALRQPPAAIWTDSERVHRLTEVTLRFGQELVLRTQDAARREPLSKLFVTTTAASPL